ncbi:MAG: hypothetical protein QG597_455, partial [Actinomycetota bacterium]|nr:hypothetical protein [Actinomycetota bacterium]
AAVELRTEDLRQLWLAWLTSAVGTGLVDGWWHQTRDDGLEPEKLVGDELPQIVAAVCRFALHGQPRTAIMAWQAMLVAAWDAGLLDPTPDTAHTISTSLRWRLTGEQLQEDLLGWATFLDDELCGHRMREKLDLDRLDLEPMGRGSPISDRVLVGGIADPLSDPRVPGLVLEARRYRRCEEPATTPRQAFSQVLAAPSSSGRRGTRDC